MFYQKLSTICNRPSGLLNMILYINDGCFRLTCVSNDRHWTRGGYCHLKRSEVWKEHLRCTKILFCKRGLKFFSSLRGADFLKITHYLLSYLSSSIKGIAKVPSLDLMRYQNRSFLPLKGTTNTPVYFTSELSPSIVLKSEGACDRNKNTVQKNET